MAQLCFGLGVPRRAVSFEAPPECFPATCKLNMSPGASAESQYFRTGLPDHSDGESHSSHSTARTIYDPRGHRLW